MHAVAKVPDAVEPKDMPRPPADTVQVTFRVPSGWLAEADTIADLLSRPGMRASRTDAFRAALARGFQAIRAEAAKPAPPPPPSSPAPRHEGTSPVEDTTVDRGQQVGPADGQTASAAAAALGHETRKRRAAARDWLRLALADGPVEEAEIYAGAALAGHDRDALRHARDREMVTVLNNGSVRVWRDHMDRRRRPAPLPPAAKPKA